MKVYIDFDGTLFDTDRYTKDFMNIFHEYDINEEIFDETKKILFNENKLFNINVIIDYFIEKYDIDIQLRRKIDDLLNHSYIYSDVLDCLNMLVNNGYELYLLTYGDKDFQKMKIDASNISKYFKEIIITEKDKSKLNLNYKNSIFIDNNPIEIESFCNSKAKSVIRIRRNSDRYSKIDCNILNNLECKDFYHVVQLLKGD